MDPREAFRAGLPLPGRLPAETQQPWFPAGQGCLCGAEAQGPARLPRAFCCLFRRPLSPQPGKKGAADWLPPGDFPPFFLSLFKFLRLKQELLKSCFLLLCEMPSCLPELRPPIPTRSVGHGLGGWFWSPAAPSRSLQAQASPDFSREPRPSFGGRSVGAFRQLSPAWCQGSSHKQPLTPTFILTSKASDEPGVLECPPWPAQDGS